MSNKIKTEAAQVAAIVKAELRKHGIACSVKSSNFSMGSSVSVRVYDQMPATVAKIREFCGQFTSGYFDGMEDIYVYTSKGDGPTTKYLHVTNEISHELRAECEEWVKANWCAMSEYEFERVVNRELYEDEGFWRERKPRLLAA